MPTSLEPTLVAALTRRVAPRAMVIIDEADPALVDALWSIGCGTSIVRVYRSSAGGHAFARSGFVPVIAEPLVSTCLYTAFPIRGLKLDRPESLPCGHLEEIVVCTERGESTWTVMVSGQTKFLLAKGHVPLDEEVSDYDLFWGDDGRYRLRPSSNRSKRKRSP